jgi:hypothetical protein
MTDDRMTFQHLLEKASDADLLREMIGFAAERLFPAIPATVNGSKQTASARFHKYDRRALERSSRAAQIDGTHWGRALTPLSRPLNHVNHSSSQTKGG